MTSPHGGAQVPVPRTGRTIVLALTFLLVLAAVSASTALLVYTALNQDLKTGLFALAFAVLSARAVLSWFLWRKSDQQTVVGDRQKRAEAER
ncbi:MAG: hypothetical protein LC751_02900 [Actinobacteria bacterium]|jgi:hypothetical protein|nr:hypothetical protein [Actinomycetota bacterium]MCA1737548.1 hypothetical protein [Actinomycetota bacterium]